MQFDIVQGTYNARAKNVGCNRLVNFYPEMHPQGKGKNVKSLIRTPGYRLIGASHTEGTNRGMYTSSTGRLFLVVWDRLIEILSDETTISRGTMVGTSGYCRFSDNGNQLLITDGTTGYIFTFATNVLAVISDPDFPENPTTNVFTDGYFLVSSTRSGQFFFSASYDGTSWNALDFATAEYSADSLQGIAKTSNGTIWMIGQASLELWQNVGTADLPWRRIAGSVKEVGCIAPYSIVSNGERVLWLGGGSAGYASVYMGAGYDVVKVSTPALEYNIKTYEDIHRAIAFTYSDEGHDFYVISFSSDATHVFDMTTGEWHERGTYSSLFGDNIRQFANGYGFAFNKHYVASYYNANVYEMSLNVLLEDTEVIMRKIVTAHLSDENRFLRIAKMEIDCEKGVGLVGGAEPKLMLRSSFDGGHTWSNQVECGVGMIGAYTARCIFRRLGIARDRVFEITVSDPVDWNIINAFIEVA